MIPLTKLQKEIMKEFYLNHPTKVIFNKDKRRKLWKKTKARSEDLDFDKLQKVCPALVHQIQKSYDTGKNIQSAVFSECVYAQTLANMLNLTNFDIYSENNTCVPEQVKELLKSYCLVPRYVYADSERKRMLIQAGGHGGIDSALIMVTDLTIYTIEFKEQGAKTSEPDLPKYGEDGKLRITQEFIEKNPQFKEMLIEQKDLNFFENIGRNIKQFSKESVYIAVANNYVKKYADVICTEDRESNLVMIPANQASQWANITGEIRPAGRNHYEVWTPKALRNFLIKKGARIEENNVSIAKKLLIPRKARGGNGSISGYKINSIFFVYCEDCKEIGDNLEFKIKKVQQLNPTIAGKMFFNNDLQYEKVKEYYGI